MTDSNQGMIERELTPTEIEERNKLNLDLQGQRDDNLIEISEKRKQIRMLNAKNKRLELQSSEVRREIRTGRVFESRQGVLPLEEPAARHGEGALLDPVELRHLITCVRPRELWPTVKDVEGWHEQVRADVQKWCQVEHARARPIAGTPVPSALAMPNVLENIELDLAAHLEQQARKAGKKRTAPAATGEPEPFVMRYPLASTAAELNEQLGAALQGVLVPSVETLAQWHPGAPEFEELAAWARIEIAYLNTKDGLPLPSRIPMPFMLAQLRSKLASEVAAFKKASKRARHERAQRTATPKRKPAGARGRKA